MTLFTIDVNHLLTALDSVFNYTSQNSMWPRNMGRTTTRLSRLTLWPDYWPHTPGLNHLDHTHSLKGLTAHTYIVKVVSNHWHWNPSPSLLLYCTRTTCLSTARFLLECLWFLMKNMNSYAGLNILICIVSVQVTFTITECPETIIPSQYSKVCSETKASGLPDYGGRHWFW